MTTISTSSLPAGGLLQASLKPIPLWRG
ncbi:hypothetical protein PMI16_01915, partial [Herbaspirillum sp. CF444]